MRVGSFGLYLLNWVHLVVCCLVDTIKVRLQAQSAANPIYSGAFDCVKKTLQWEGVGGLYKVCCIGL